MIFISHCADDARETRLLSFELIRRGLPIWLDETRLEAGLRVNEVIQTGIRDAQLVVFVVSEKSVTSSYVQDEIMQAEQLGKPTVTVLLNEASEDIIPASLREYKWYRASKNSDITRVANAIDRSYRRGENGVLQSQLWIKDPVEIFTGSGTLDFVSTPPIHELDDSATIRIFDSKFDDLSERASLVADTDLAWLTGTPNYEIELKRIRELPKLVSGSLAYVESNLGLLHASEQGLFEKYYFESLLLVLVRSIRSQLELAEYNAAPREDLAHKASARRSDWVSSEPFEGIRLDVSISGEHIGAAKGPDYVKRIDLPPRMVPGTEILLTHDLGRIAGWVTGWSAWNDLLGGRSIEPFLPSPKDVWVGPA